MSFHTLWKCHRMAILDIKISFFPGGGPPDHTQKNSYALSTIQKDPHLENTHPPPHTHTPKILPTGLPSTRKSNKQWSDRTYHFLENNLYFFLQQWVYGNFFYSCSIKLYWKYCYYRFVVNTPLCICISYSTLYVYRCLNKSESIPKCVRLTPCWYRGLHDLRLEKPSPLSPPPAVYRSSLHYGGYLKQNFTHWNQKRFLEKVFSPIFI